MVKISPANAGDASEAGLLPGSGRSPGGGDGNPTPAFLPGQFHGQRSLLGYSPWGGRESDMTEQLSTHHAYSLSVVLKAELFTAQDAMLINS